jgi:glucose-1-phosphate thymidylyltransferase
VKSPTAVILAAGTGTRMRRIDGSAALTSQQRAMADSGNKALIPFDRPFLDYSLGALADAGFRSVCLVVSPYQDDLVAHCERLETERLEIQPVLQAEPRGTADAVLTAESAIGTESEFAVLNGDNYYSIEVLRSLQTLGGPGLVAFDRAGLLARGESNLDRERMARFAIVQTDPAGLLARIIEKPDPATYSSLPEPVLVSLNCWRFSSAIFRACERIPESERGELELTSAVQYCLDELGEPFRVAISTSPVLDLSERGDIAAVASYLEGVEVRL